MPFVGDEKDQAVETTSEAPEPGFSDTHVFPGDYERLEREYLGYDINYSSVLEAGPYERLPYEVVNLTSDVDGAHLKVGLVRPELPEGEQAPVIVQASPYYHDAVVHYSEPERNEENLGADLRFHYYAHPLVENYVAHGYAVAFVPVRGTGGTGGCSDVFGPLEQADLDQITTWLGTREWSNGNVGFIGLSYDGGTAWTAAATGNPYVKTIVPIAGLSDTFHLSYPNGTSSALGPMIAPAYFAYSNTGYNPPPRDGRSAQDAVENAVCPATLRSLEAGVESYVTGERDLLGFWEARNHRDEVEARYEGSVFLVQALNDENVGAFHQYPWVNTLEDHDIPVKHWLGRWGHLYPDSAGIYELRTPRMDFAETLLHWFDHWLKEEPRDLGPRVQVADNEHRWRSADTWPPNDATPRVFHMTPAGELAPNPSEKTDQLLVGPDPARTPPREHDPDPSLHHTTAAEEACAGCAIFRSPALEEPMRFAGRPAFDVPVTPSGPQGYVTVHLYLEDADGRAELLTGGQIDLRFADGDGEPEQVTPGEPTAVNLTLDPEDALVPEGHRLVLVVSQASYRGDLDTRAAQPEPGATPVLLHVGDGQSRLTFEAFTVDEEALFTPPLAEH